MAAIIAVAAIIFSGRANAQTGVASVRVLADAAIGAHLLAAVSGFGAAAEVATAAATVEAACSKTLGSAPRLAWIRGAPEGLERGRCVDDPTATFVYVPVGYRAVALVAPARAPIWPVSSVDIYRALDNSARNAGVVPRWNAISTGAPDLPASVAGLGAVPDVARLFLSGVIVPGCVAVQDKPVPGGSPICGGSRTDAAGAALVASSSAAAWATAAPDGQLGVVDAATLARLDPALRVLALDGALPTPANIASGTYAAAEQVGLMAVLPRAASPTARATARKVAFEMLSEASVGVDSAFAEAGLLVQPARARVESRASVFAFFVP